MKTLPTIDRRQFLALSAAGLAPGQDRVTSPVVSEDACPLERIQPVGRDGHRGLAFLRKPPGAGPFPAIVIVHGGLTMQPEERIKGYAAAATASRFLAAGYVVAPITYRSRDDDPQSKVSLRDCLAAVDHVRRRAYVDSRSLVVYGCSGGGDLALEIAAAAEICAAVPEEPASMLLTGVFNAAFPKKGERFTPADASPISENPKRYYTAEYHEITRAKLNKIRCPILLIQGDQHPVNRFNAEVLIPELRAAGKALEVITYPGQRHCFCFGAARGSAAALKAFHDIDKFCGRHVSTKPRPIDSSLVKLVAEPAA